MRRKRVGRYLIGAITCVALIATFIWAPARQGRLNADLMAAIRENDAGKVQRLLARGADSNCVESPEQVPFWLRTRNLLFGRRASVRPGDRTPILEALGSTGHEYLPENAPLVKALLEAGADPNVTDQGGMTPLMMASTCCKEETLKLLLAHGANPNLRVGGDSTALLYAVMADQPGEITALIKSGADPKLANNYGESPLTWANIDPNSRRRLQALLQPAGK